MSTPESEVKPPVRRPSHLNRDVVPGSFTEIKEYYVPAPEQRNVNVPAFYPVNLPPMLAEIPQPVPTTGWFELRWNRFKLEHISNEEEEMLDLHARRTLKAAPAAFVIGTAVTGFVSKWVPRAKGIRLPVALAGGLMNTAFHFWTQQANFDRVVLACADEDSVLRRDTVRKYAHLHPLIRTWMEKDVERTLENNKRAQELIDSGYFKELEQRAPALAKSGWLYPYRTTLDELKLTPLQVQIMEKQRREAEERAQQVEAKLAEERGADWREREQEEAELHDAEVRDKIYRWTGQRAPPGWSINPGFVQRACMYFGMDWWNPGSWEWLDRYISRFR